MRQSLFWLLVVGLFAFSVLGLCSGAVFLSPLNLPTYFYSFWQSNQQVENMVFELRLIRVGTAIIVGGGLAICGSVLQRLLRNPLADPYVVGISAGGTTAAVVSIVFGLPSIVGVFPLRSLFAFVGCLLTMLIIFILKRKIKLAQEDYTIPIIGLVLNTFLSALVMLLLVFADKYNLGEIYRWMIGNLSGAEWNEFIILGTLAIVGIVLCIIMSPAINALGLGEEFAFSIGFNTKKIRNYSFLWIALIISAVIPLAGSVGFIGLIVPHVARKLFGTEIRTEFIASFLGGGMLLVVSDILARVILIPTELPVGIFTALMGAPALAFIVLRSNKARS